MRLIIKPSGPKGKAFRLLVKWGKYDIFHSMEFARKTSLKRAFGRFARNLKVGKFHFEDGTNHYKVNDSPSIS